MVALHPPASIATNFGNTYSYSDFVPSNQSSVLAAFNTGLGRIGYYQTNLPDGYVLNNSYELYGASFGDYVGVTSSSQPNSGDASVLTGNKDWSSAIYKKVDPIQFFNISGYYKKTFIDPTLNSWQGIVIKPYGSDIGYIFAYTAVSISGIVSDTYIYFIMAATDGVDIYPWIILKAMAANDETAEPLMAGPERGYATTYKQYKASGITIAVSYNGYKGTLNFNPSSISGLLPSSLPSLPLTSTVTTSYIGTGTPTATSTTFNTSTGMTTTSICSIISTQNNTTTQPQSTPSGNPIPTGNPNTSTPSSTPTPRDSEPIPEVDPEMISTYRGFSGTEPFAGVYPAFNGLDPKQSYQPAALYANPPWEGFACIDVVAGVTSLIPVNTYTGSVTSLTPVVYIDYNGSVIWPKSVITTKGGLSAGRMYYLVKVTGGSWELHLDGGSYPSNTSILYLGFAISPNQFLFNVGSGYLGTSYKP